MTRYRWLLALCLCLALAPRVSGADDDDDKRTDLGIVWYTIGGGGGTSSSDKLVVQGTIGQPDAGVCTHETMCMIGGFWGPDGLDDGDDGDDDRVSPSLQGDASMAGVIQAKVVGGGIEIRLDHEFIPELIELVLERGATAEGPWERVPFEQSAAGLGALVVSPKGVTEQAFYYRVQVNEPGVPTRMFGPKLIAMDAAITVFSLAPISPNPARGAATISWSLPRTSRLRLTIHDVQGRQVAILADGEYPAGRHSVRWNSTGARGGASPGMYFVRLRGSDGLLVRRFVVAP